MCIRDSYHTSKKNFLVLRAKSYLCSVDKLKVPAPRALPGTENQANEVKWRFIQIDLHSFHCLVELFCQFQKYIWNFGFDFYILDSTHKKFPLGRAGEILLAREPHPHPRTAPNPQPHTGVWKKEAFGAFLSIYFGSNSIQKIIFKSMLYISKPIRASKKLLFSDL